MSNPLVTVIVPHHLNENDEYLNWCIYSILQSVGVEIELICISDAVKSPDIRGYTATLIHDRTLSNVTKKWHHGVKIANPSSKYVMVISDDVMVSKHTIAELADTIGDLGMIVGPASNCDSTTRYRTNFILEREDGRSRYVGLKSTLEDIEGYEECVINYPKGRRTLIDTGWISFYCTMFPKAVLQAVGDFDEKLDVRYNDVDYCERARKLGIISMINLGVFALHFGDKTLPKCTKPEEYAAADRAWMDKHRGLPLPEDDGDLL